MACGGSIANMTDVVVPRKVKVVTPICRGLLS